MLAYLYFRGISNAQHMLNYNLHVLWAINEYSIYVFKYLDESRISIPNDNLCRSWNLHITNQALIVSAYCDVSS